MSDPSRDPGLRSGNIISEEVVSAALGRLAGFTSIEQEQLLGTNDLSTLNRLLGSGQVVADLVSVVEAQSVGKMIPMLVDHKQIEGALAGRRLVEIIAMEGNITHSKFRFSTREPGGFMEEFTLLPGGEFTPGVWREFNMPFTQTARTKNESTWATYYPTVDSGPDEPYIHFASEAGSLGNFALVAQGVVNEVLAISAESSIGHLIS